jgi:multiple sugar transport system permease protein
MSVKWVERKGRYTYSPYLLLIPISALLVIVILVPEIWALLISISNYSPGSPAKYVGFSNYIRVAKDPVFIQALINNLIFLVLAISFEFLVGFGFALLLFQGFPLRRVWTSLLIAPYAISPVVACVMWKYLLDPSYGVVNYVLSVFGVSSVPWFGNTSSAFIAIIITDVWINSPFIQIIAYSALISIPNEVIEASIVDGTNIWQRFRFVIIPLITPALFVALIFRLIFVFREFGIPWMLTQGGPGHSTEILSVYLYKQGFRYFEFGSASAVAWVMLLFTSLISVPIVKKMYTKIFYG